MRVVSFDKARRRIGLSMKKWTEGEQGGRKPRSDSSYYFDSDDADFRLSDEELDALTVEDEGPFTTTLEAAFARADEVAASKAEAKRYYPQIL